jgi:hypothetical protein
MIKDSYLALIQNSAGANFWRNLYFKINGRKQDILQDGELSCAFFASGVLLVLGLIKETHTTINGLLADMEIMGWQEIGKPKLGSVLVWEEKLGHRHLGFFMGGKAAISNRSSLHKPGRHHLTFGVKKDGSPKRKIIRILWHEKLND